MLLETLYLLIIGSLTFTVLQRCRRGPVRLTCLLLLLACGVSAPYLMISQLRIAHYVQRMTLSVFSVLSMFKSLEVIAGTTLPGVLDSRGNWLVSSLVY
jgi:predicted membrane channel-forming protein YqfA (hemolysin III family)